MGFFTKVAKAPQGTPEAWSPEEVKAWIKSQKLNKLWTDNKPVLKPLNGQDLLALDVEAAFADHKQLPELLAALKELRMSPSEGQSQTNVLSDTAASTAARPAFSLFGSRSASQRSPMPASYCGEEEELDGDDDRAPDNARHAPVGSAAAVREDSEYLMAYTPETNPDVITAFLATLGGKVGAGLAELAASQPAVGRLFGCTYELHTSVQSVVVNRENCAKLEQLSGAVLHILEKAGRQKRAPTSEAVHVLCEKLDQALKLVAVFARPGWLFHMACNEKLKEQFDTLHDAIVDVVSKVEVQDAGADVSRVLARGDYRDVTKALRRLLKQLGGGNFTKGLRTLMACTDPDTTDVRELASLLDVRGEALLQEAAGLPLLPSDIDADEAYLASLSDTVITTELMLQGVFEWYDRERSGALDAQALSALLSDLGMLDARKAQEAEQFVAATLKSSDKDGDGLLSFEEFCACYTALPISKARRQLRTDMGMGAEEDLRGVFLVFASFGSRQAQDHLDVSHFTKLLKDCDLLDKRCNIPVCEIIFAQVKPKGQRRMAFDPFVAALGLCSAKRGTSLEATVKQILAVGRPTAHGTKTAAVRLHDDKSTYTGVYSRGGPNTVEPCKDLHMLCDRSSADVRGVKLTPPPTTSSRALGEKRSSFGGSVVEEPPRRAAASVTPPVPARRRTGPGAGEEVTLATRFADFATFGSCGGSAAEAATADATRRMDGTLFVKLCRETKLLDRAFTTTSADLIFARVKAKGSNKLGFAEFQRALALVAEEKGVPLADVHAAILHSQGPMLTPSHA